MWREAKLTHGRLLAAEFSAEINDSPALPGELSIKYPKAKRWL